MPQLLISTKVVRPDGSIAANSHQHFVYIVEPREGEQPRGESSRAKGHVHDVLFTDVGPVLAESDGHTHSISGEHRPETEKRAMDAKELVSTVESLYRTAKSREEKSRKEAEIAEAAYQHEQWDQSVKEHLNEQQRACITVNKLEQKVDNLTGYQRQNRTDWRFYPMENGDQRVADILNIIVKHITEACYYGREESMVFEDATVCGRGSFNLYVDFSDKADGEIKIERFPWDEVFYGPHERLDLSDCDYLIKTKWFSLDKLRNLYPDHDFIPEAMDLLHTENVPQREGLGDDARYSSSASGAGDGDDFARIAKKEYRLFECWRKEYRRVFVLANASDGFVYAADGWSDAEVAQAKTIPGFVAIPRVTHRIRVTKIANHSLLEDEYPDLPVQDFHTFPLYAKYRNGVFHGKLRGVIELQHLINKCYSQFADILNKVTNYGWFYDDSTFPSSKEAEQWLMHSATPGFNIKLTDTGKPPSKVDSPRFPSELVSALTMFAADMREVMNINLEVLGQDQNQSGVVVRQKIVQQLIGNDFLFDNLSFVKKRLGRLIVGYIQQLYTPKRIMRIVANEDQREPVNIGGQPIPRQDGEGENPNDPRVIEELLRTQDLSDYDIVVSESATSPSAMMSNFLLLLDMASKGIAIPPSAIIDFAPIPNKGKILEQIAAAQQQQQQQEQMKYGTEIQKAIIAQGGNPQGGQNV